MPVSQRANYVLDLKMAANSHVHLLENTILSKSSLLEYKINTHDLNKKGLFSCQLPTLMDLAGTKAIQNILQKP